MIKRRQLYYSLFAITIWLSVVSRGFCQENYETLKSALIIQFVQHITWPEEETIQMFNIGVYGADTTTFEILNKNSLHRKVKDKNYQVRWVTSLNKLAGINALFIDQSKSKDLVQVAQAIERKNILLITESSTDTKNIMLNIMLDDKKKRLSFEVNKANIIIEHLELNPELLLLGGTEVDIRELYRDIKQQFEEERVLVEQKKAFIEAQILEIKKQKNRIATNEKEINSLKENAAELTKQIYVKEHELSKLASNITLQKKSMDDREVQLANQTELSKKLENDLKSQSSLITMRSKELDSLVREGEKQRATISIQSNSLQSKQEIINLQKKVITIIIVFVMILGVLGLIIIRYYRIRKILASKLSESYSTLREQHESILQLNEELNSINEMLEDKVKQRTKVLEERNTQLTEYAFINSHLLRAPLSQIQGLSFLLKKEEENIQDKNLVAALTKSADDLDAIIRKINDLLNQGRDFSREEIEQLINRKFDMPNSPGLSQN